MRNMTMESSIDRMKALMNHSIGDALKPNISETVEYKVKSANGKTYGIVRECQRYFIKEQNSDGSFDYIGGIGNKSENEYPSYNSALRNLELKIRSINEATNTNISFQTFESAPQAEYIVEATEIMRDEINRVKEVMSGVSNIMNETKTEFITKPKFKDPEGFGQANDPKKQGEPFDSKSIDPELDRDNAKSSKNAKNAGEPFDDEAKADPAKFDVELTNKKPCEAGNFGEPAKNVPDNSVANQKPKGGKVVKVTESQLKEMRKLIEGYFDDDFVGMDDDDENPLLKKFDYPEINKLGRGRMPIAATRPGEDIDLGNDSDENLHINNQFGISGDNVFGSSDSEEEVENTDEIVPETDWVVERPNGYEMKYFSSWDEAKNWVDDNDPDGEYDLNIRPINKSENNDKLVKEITEAVLKAFGQHPSYQKPAFTTPSSKQELVPGTKEWDDESAKTDKPYGQKIGSSAPFTDSTKQKVGEGEIGSDGDDVMKGKTPQSLPSQGKKSGTKPFDSSVEESGDKIVKGTPVRKGETQQKETKLGQKGDTQPFDKKIEKEKVKESKKEEYLKKLTENIINDLKKK